MNELRKEYQAIVTKYCGVPISPLEQLKNAYEANLHGATKETWNKFANSAFKHFPALIAHIERDQRVIEAAEKALKKVRDWVTEDDGYTPEHMIEREAEYQKKRTGEMFMNQDYMDMLKALVEFDKAKQL